MDNHQVMRDNQREAGLYAYGLKVGAQEVLRRQFNWGLRHLLIPVPYWRSMEFRLVRSEGAFRSTDRILDIGSPKLLAIYLAKVLGAEVYSTDLEDYFVREYTALREWEHLSPKRFHVQVEDGRALSFPDASFDKVFSVSVMEHIPDDGDVACAREMARVLAPGGRCLITVPFSPTSRIIYRKANQFYWANSSAEQSDEMVFFQRRYSETDLRERIIAPSGLRLRALRYVGERVLTHSPKEVLEYLPFSATIPIGILQPLFARLLQTPPVDRWQDIEKPLCAFIALEKPLDADV